MITRIRAWIQERIEDYRWGQYYRWSTWAMAQTRPIEGLRRWDDTLPAADQKYFQHIRIIARSEEDKDQLLKAFQYIHDMRELDTDYMAVNYLAHVYTNPDIISVEPEEIDHDN